MNDYPRWFDAALGILIVGGGFGIVAALIFYAVPEGNRDALLFAAGLVLGWGGAVVNNRYGSSKGSERKTEMLDKQPSGNPGDPVHTQEE